MLGVNGFIESMKVYLDLNRKGLELTYYQIHKFYKAILTSGQTLFFEIFFSTCFHNDLHLERMDIKIAFLHDGLGKMILMSQLYGSIVLEKIDWVIYLKKFLYGLWYLYDLA